MNHPLKNASPVDVAGIRADFPILDQEINGHPLVYLDNGASTQKPNQVIDEISRFYREDYANVHRGIHTLSQRATDQYEHARIVVRDFLGARSEKEIVFTRGTTEAINLVAHTWGMQNIGQGDEILVSEIEHHSNIVPWQILAERNGAKIVVIPVLDNGELDMKAYHERLNSKTRLVAITQLSNALGSIPPLEEIIASAHKRSAVVVVDGAQAVAHTPTDVAALDCDFYTFSGHKIYGPSGIGALYGKESLLEEMPPYQGGGDMISRVSFSGTQYNELPYKFEAGTPNIADTVGLAAALDYVSAIGIEQIAQHEASLLAYMSEKAGAIDGLIQIGQADHMAGIFSFIVKGAHATDIGTLLDQQGVAIRVGHHCAMPVMERYGLGSTARASLAVYNNQEDIDRFVQALSKAVDILR